MRRLRDTKRDRAGVPGGGDGLGTRCRGTSREGCRYARAWVKMCKKNCKKNSNEKIISGKENSTLFPEKSCKEKENCAKFEVSGKHCKSYKYLQKIQIKQLSPSLGMGFGGWVLVGAGCWQAAGGPEAGELV